MASASVGSRWSFRRFQCFAFYIFGTCRQVHVEVTYNDADCALKKIFKKILKWRFKVSTNLEMLKFNSTQFSSPFLNCMFYSMKNKLLEKLIRPFKYWNNVKLNICLYAHRTWKPQAKALMKFSHKSRNILTWFFPLEWMQVRRRQKKKRKPNPRVVNLMHNPVGKWDENDMFYCTWSLFEIFSSVKCTNDTYLHNFDLTCCSADKIKKKCVLSLSLLEKLGKRFLLTQIYFPNT